MENSDRDNGLMDSIAALRSVLMLDTPTRAVLAGGRGYKDRQPQPQRQPCFSPNLTTQATTPASRNKNDIEERSRGVPPLSGKSPSALLKTPRTPKQPPAPEVLTTTKVLQNKVQIMETSQAELEKRLKEEIDRRTTLETTYEKLSEFRAKQSSQLERITASRDNFRDESIELKKTLETERNKHAETVTIVKNTANSIIPSIESQRSKEKQKFKEEIELLQKRMRKKDERYVESESLVKSLTKEVERLNVDLKTCRQSHESALQTTIKSHTKETESFQATIARLESDRVEQTNKERKNAETNRELLQKAQTDLNKLKQDHSSEKESMESEKIELEDALKEATEAGKESERELEDITADLTRLNHQVKEAHVARKEYDDQLQILIAELDNVKAQLAARKELQLEKAELEQRLRDAEENFSKLAATKDHPTAYQELQLENRALERRLRDAEENCNTFEKELQETNMELGGLKQNLEEAEQIELQNEALVTRLQSMSEELAGTENLQERLKANESDTITKDKLLRNMELELEEARTGLSKRQDNVASTSTVALDKSEADVKLSKELKERERAFDELHSEFELMQKNLLQTEIMLKKRDVELSNAINGKNKGNDAVIIANDAVIIDNLQEELKATKEKLAHSKEQLGISALSNLNRLVEVATHREKVRDLEGDLEELEEKLIGESHEVDEGDKKRDNEEDEESPRKRSKTIIDDKDYDEDSFDDDDDDDDIVL